MRTLYTTTTSFINSRLAAIYDVPSPSLEGFGRVDFPEDGERSGLLGHVSFLAQQAHPTRTSPTLRGLYVREKLLCQDMPSPPANVDTTLPEASQGVATIKEILELHMKDPTCAACHIMTDLIGLGLEHFDGIGRFRLTTQGEPIEPAGILDGVSFADGRSLSQAIADHPRVVPCFVETLWAYANGHALTDGESGLVGELEHAFSEDGHRMLGLVEAIAMSEGFRRVGEVTP